MDRVVEWVRVHRKFIVAVLAAASVAVSFTADGEFSQNDIAGTVAAFLGALGVYQLPNDSPAEARVRRGVDEVRDRLGR